MKYLLTFLIFLSGYSIGYAETLQPKFQYIDPGVYADIKFDNEIYTSRFESRAPFENFVEYARPQEDIKAWTKLMSVRYYPHMKDPEQAVIKFAKLLKMQNPKAQFQVMTKEDKSEALIDFMTWPTADKTGNVPYMEFNVFRYRKTSLNNPGLVAYQFAYKITDIDAEDAQTLKDDRKKWLSQMMGLNIDEKILQKLK